MLLTLPCVIARIGRTATELVLAVAMLVPAALASQIDERLDPLFIRLKRTDSEAEAAARVHAERLRRHLRRNSI